MYRKFNQYKNNKDKYMVLVKNKTGIFVFFRIYINSHMGIIKYGGRLWTLTYTKILKRELTVRFT